MVRKCLFFLSAATATSLGVSACAVTTSQDLTIDVTHAGPPSCTNGPQLVTDSSTYAPGAPVTITSTCGSGNPKDWIAVNMYYSDQEAGGGWTGRYWTYLGSTTPNAPVTTTLYAPNATVDRDLQYHVKWFVNDTFVVATASSPFTVTKSINLPAPTATLPTALAADPFTPAHIITVCASGCDYTSLGAATDAASTAGWDNVEIKISAGEYDYPAHSVDSRYVPHLWIKGISPDGKTFPHLFGFTSSSSTLIANTTGYGTGAGFFTMDNMEIGPWNYWAMKQLDGSTWTLRNVYVRDAAQGLITANVTDFTLNIYNSVFARSGGGGGPEHDVYVGEGKLNNIVNVVNSVFEQSVVGHAFKERAKFFNPTCSMFLVNQDDVYLGSETIDMDSGQPTFTNILSVNGGGAPAALTNNSSWDNVRYAADNESNIQPLQPMITGSVFLADQPNSGHWFVTLGSPLTSHATWANNTFVWPDAGSRQPGPGGVPGSSGQVADPTGALYAIHSGNTSNVTLDGTNKYFTSRADAGLPPTGTYPKGWRDFVPLMPVACKDPIGLVKIPIN